MTEILTESFCERCGTRYTFEPVTNRRKPLSAIGTLGRGIRNFVSDPGSSIDEAFAVARSESEQRTTATALEAFHRTFNFCLSCRQYTCSDCWNTVEGRCLSCAPVPEAAQPETRADTTVPLAHMDVAPAVLEVPVVEAIGQLEVSDLQAEAEALAATENEALAATEALAAAEALAATEAQSAIELAAREAAHAADEVARAAAEAKALAAAEAESRASSEAEARAAADTEAAAIAAALAQAEAAAVQAMADAEARVAAEAEAREAAERATEQAEAEAAEATIAFAPGLNLDDQIAAYEANQTGAPTSAAGLATVREAEPEVVEAVPDAEPESEAEAPRALVDAEPEPEPIRPVTEPIPTAIGHPIPASAFDGPPSWPEPEVAAAAHAPSWPDLPAANADAAPEAGAGLPAEESMPLPAPARACPSCGLSLSASARFCRRCGTPQQVDASS